MKNNILNTEYLLEAIRLAWNKDTAVTPGDWDARAPSTGQCAVTALIIQDFLGGKIMRCEIIGNGSHYWNVLEGGGILDITADQFKGADVCRKKKIVQREILLENAYTATRYRILRELVMANLNKENNLSK